MESLKMKRMRSFLSGLLFFVLISLLAFLALTIFFEPEQTDTKPSTAIPQSIDLVAIGDSLTEGVGDHLAIGGYVPRVAEMLEEEEAVAQVESQNFGVSGETSAQILERMESNPAIQEAIVEAEIVVFTAGGNDVVKTFKKELLDVQLDSFKEPLGTYQANLRQILTLAQGWNPTAEVYVFGIYNPYEIYFSDIQEMQVIIEEWNQTTKEMTESFQQMQYVPIDTAFKSTRVLSDSNMANHSDTEQETYENPYLYKDDLFHPNETGYNKMAAILYTEMKKTKPFWLNE